MPAASKAICLVALVAICALVAAAPASVAKGGGFRPCADMPERYVNGIKVQGVGCRKAKRVVVRYTHAIIENLQHDWSVTVLGFHCDLTRKDYYGDSHRCKAGGRVILFRRGTH